MYLTLPVKKVRDKNTHKINYKGDILLTRRHLLPTHSKRVRRAPQKLNL